MTKKKSKTYTAPKYYPVKSNRNSKCESFRGSAWVDEMDWSNWWTEDNAWGSDVRCLKVRRPVSEFQGESTVHRVYCRRSDSPRIAMRDGELCWLVG